MLEISIPESLSFLQLPVLGRLILASVLGGAIGLERELSGKDAGFRTNLLICIGATLCTILSLRVGAFVTEIGPITADPSRLMAAIISGIGFLGAGTIIQARGNVTGLTTAATLWVVAAIGIAVGAGAFVIAVGTTVFVLLALIPLGLLEKRMMKPPSRWVKASMINDLELVQNLTEHLRSQGLEVKSTDIQNTSNGRCEVLFEVQGDQELLSQLPAMASQHEGIHQIELTPRSS